MAPSATRKRTILALVVAGLLVGAAVSLPALAAPVKKLYTASISPISAGTVQAYNFTITDAPSSTQSLGSVNISVPSGFTVIAVGLEIWA